ncbi:MAG: hypothetical protein K6T29_03270 [Peptococcaceae bacterium]|nr:hypothetical protein [Peptococcaceae bacterium]
MIEQKVFHAGEGRHRITLLVTITGDGIVAQFFGGEKPHVGAVALSLPRPGLKDPEKTSCNTIVVPLLGHKDDEVAKPVAEKIVKAWGRPVVVVAGMHVENASAEDIERLRGNCLAAAAALVQELQRRP